MEFGLEQPVSSQNTPSQKEEIPPLDENLASGDRQEVMVRIFGKIKALEWLLKNNVQTKEKSVAWEKERAALLYHAQQLGITREEFDRYEKEKDTD